jgi:hypothetical protein
MPKSAGRRLSILTSRQTRLIVDFYYGSTAYPGADFHQVTARLLGARGFGRSELAELFKRECLRAFDLGKQVTVD